MISDVYEKLVDPPITPNAISTRPAVSIFIGLIYPLLVHSYLEVNTDVRHPGPYFQELTCIDSSSNPAKRNGRNSQT